MRFFAPLSIYHKSGAYLAKELFLESHEAEAVVLIWEVRKQWDI